MKHAKYLCKAEDSFLVFKFWSEGCKGSVQKIIVYTETDSENVYNLGFGDYDPETGSMNDLSVTNNGDSAKVLATVASTVYTFTNGIQKFGSWLQEALPQEQGFIEWGSPTIYLKFRSILLYLVITVKETGNIS
ncbi:hypothetical protein LXM25_24130 [Dyadobacter sp. LJ53]|nr:hypothetical protein [Dyadobacter chenwenxiniae]MCF0053180.1 hypothetical protein [Dyadobacter chenwenxiniae]